MEEKATTKKAASTLTEEPVVIEIKETKRHWLTKKPREIKRAFTIKPPTLGQMIRIGKILQDLPDVPMGLPFEQSAKIVNGLAFKHGNTLIDIVSHVISGNVEPDEKIKKTVRDNVDSKTMLTIWTMYIAMQDVSAFLNSIVLMKSSDLIKTSPEDQRR